MHRNTKRGTYNCRACDADFQLVGIRDEDRKKTISCPVCSGNELNKVNEPVAVGEELQNV